MTDIESDIENVAENALRFNVEEGKLVCNGNFAASTTLAVYNMGGVKVASVAVAHDCESSVLDVAGLPHGSYIVLVKSGGRTTVHKVVL